MKRLYLLIACSAVHSCLHAQTKTPLETIEHGLSVVDTALQAEAKAPSHTFASFAMVQRPSAQIVDIQQEALKDAQTMLAESKQFLQEVDQMKDRAAARSRVQARIKAQRKVLNTIIRQMNEIQRKLNGIKLSKKMIAAREDELAQVISQELAEPKVQQLTDAYGLVLSKKIYANEIVKELQKKERELR